MVIKPANVSHHADLMRPTNREMLSAFFTAGVGGELKTKHSPAYSRSMLEYPVLGGSVVSLLTRSVIKDLKCRQSLTLYDANHAPLATYGMHILKLDLGMQCCFECHFIVTDVSNEILGSVFLAKYDLLLDLQNKQLINSTIGLRYSGVVTTAGVNTVLAIQLSGLQDHQLAERYSALLSEFTNSLSPRHKCLDFL